LDFQDPNDDEAVVFIAPESSRFTLAGITDVNQAFKIMDPEQATAASVWSY